MFRVLLLSLLCFSSNNIYAEHVTGASNLDHRKFDNLTSDGYLQFFDLNVEGEFISHGAVIIKD